jgi:hypothetical protein
MALPESGGRGPEVPLEEIIISVLGSLFTMGAKAVCGQGGPVR